MQTRLGGQRDSVPHELCIRFVNTVAWRLRDPQEERLPSCDMLLDWLVDNDLCERRHLPHLRAVLSRHTERATEFHAAALALREAIYNLLHGMIVQERPQREALRLLNAHLVQPCSGIALAPVGTTLRWRRSAMNNDPHDMLKPIAISAASLMSGPRGGRVRQCSDDRGCGWLFVDESRAQNRRWCAMGDCGNRAKAARHRARQKGAPAAQD
jgi:predicted RNA-binding Zn ribbon-like protein